jgi:hypothetical protein
MKLAEEQILGLNIALEEAVLLGLEVDSKRRMAAATFAVLTLPETGPVPEDRRVQFLFAPVGRIAASLRNGRWDDPKAGVSQFKLEELLGVVQSFKGLPIYGWEFFDMTIANNFDRWVDRCSIDLQLGEDGHAHTIDLFQEGPNRHLDIRLWFDEFIIRNPTGGEIALADFAADGKRWWDGLYAGDKRTDGFGVFPLGSKRKDGFGIYPSENTNPFLNVLHNPIEHLIEELIASQAGRDWEDNLDDSQTIGLRKSLMQKIVKHGAKSVEPLLNNLHNKDWAVRDDIAMMLGFIKEPKVVEPLVIMMNTDESLSVRLSAAIALERIGTPESYQAAKQWYIANNVSLRRRVSFKLGHWLLFGETDPGLMERVAQVASSRNTTSKKVIQAWSMHQGIENPPSTTPAWTFRLSPEECAYLEASVELH